MYLLWDPGACVWHCVRKRDEQLSGMSIISVLLGKQRIGWLVGDGDLQHHQTLVWHREHLHIVLIPAKRKHSHCYVQWRVHSGSISGRRLHRKCMTQMLTLAEAWRGQRSKVVFQTGSSASSCSGRFCRLRIPLGGSSPFGSQTRSSSMQKATHLLFGWYWLMPLTSEKNVFKIEIFLQPI